RDPQPAWQRAEAELTRALEIEATTPGAHAQLAHVHAGAAAYATAHHRDATARLDRAFVEARRAGALDAENTHALQALAITPPASRRLPRAPRPRSPGARVPPRRHSRSIARTPISCWRPPSSRWSPRRAASPTARRW